MCKVNKKEPPTHCSLSHTNICPLQKGVFIFEKHLGLVRMWVDLGSTAFLRFSSRAFWLADTVLSLSSSLMKLVSFEGTVHSKIKDTYFSSNL